MNTWKPTEGMKRAEKVVADIEASALPCGIVLHDPTFRWRMVELVSHALDQALRDGAEMDALASVVGNGSATEAVIEDAANRLGWEIPTTTIDALKKEAAIATGVMIDNEDGSIDIYPAGLPTPPKKRGRGRPKGSKKKAKPQAEPTEMQP